MKREEGEAWWHCGLMVSALDSGASGPGMLLCSWARHFTITVSLSTQVYKWVSANLMLGVARAAMDWHPIQGAVEIFLVASCYQNRDKLRPNEPLGPMALKYTTD